MDRISRSQLAATAVAALVVVVLGVVWVQRQAAAQTPAPAGGPGQGAGRSGAPAAGDVRLEGPRAASRVLVHVAGAVRRPGVYPLPGGARVRDAVRRAGGATGGGDANAINLAAKVADGQQVVVPAKVRAAAGPAGGTGGAPAVAPAAAGGPGSAGPISLSSATAEQLDTLDGVGPATAAKILAYRRQHGGFGSIDELAQVPGIGPKKLAALKEQLQP